MPEDAEGGLEYSAPPVAGLEQPFCTALRDHSKGHTEALESPGGRDAGAGLSVRDIEERFQWQWFVWQAGATYAPLAPSVAN